jgi:hypothetical protein
VALKMHLRAAVSLALLALATVLYRLSPDLDHLHLRRQNPIAPVNVLAASANLSPPYGVAVDSKGNVFFTDGYYGYFVLRLDATTGILTLVAGNGAARFSGDEGLTTNATLNTPLGLALDSAGNLYIADFGNARIRKVSNGVITTVAGKRDVRIQRRWWSGHQRPVVRPGRGRRGLRR